MVEKSADYALIMHHAVRHVGLTLEGAAPAALSFSDLAKDYDHPVPSDLSRVRLHEKVADERAAKVWVIRRAVSMIDGLAIDGDMVSFAPGKGFDDLSWKDGKLERPGPDPYAKFRDAFNPMIEAGIFASNIRDEIGDLTELRESMKAWNWIPEFPALVDERGVVLVGNRRMKVAKELGIEPVTKTLVLGQGDAADAERFKLAIASNIGSKKLGPNDRKRIAEYLYNDREWSQQKIAEALTVSQQVISKDLIELPQRGNSEKPKRGRPRGNKSFAVKAEKIADTKNDLDRKIEPLIEQGVSRDGIAKTLNVPERVVRDAQERYVGRVQERKVKADQTCTCPVCGHVHYHTHTK